MQVDPDGVQSREDLARELTALRNVASLTVRDLAKRVDAPAATIGDYFAGRHLPGTRQLPLYLALLDACGVQDPVEVERWVAALARVRLSTDGRAGKGPSPYRGLDAFGESDAELFFGRQAAIAELLGCLRRVRDGSPTASGAVAVVGPSGSGKTSLLLAGLLPAIRGGALDGETTHWEVVAVTPDTLDPGLAEVSTGTHRVVILDQLESTLALPPDERASVLACIERLQETALLVVGLRADFYQTAVSESAFLPALRNQVILGPMTVDELREAVVNPVRQVGAGIEEGLVDLIFSDLAPGSPPGYAHEAGALPLLSYALLATWERSTRNHLTISDYRAVGGLRGAIHQAAENVYESLSPAEQSQTPRMFARLVRVDDQGPPTRMSAARDEFTSSGESDPDGNPEDVLERFVSARLLTADAQSVQISHEALLGAWPRLAGWVESDRDWLRLHHQLNDAARIWTTSERDESLLWSGARLETVREVAESADREHDLNRDESEFLTGSVEHQQEQQRLRRRRTRRTQQLLGAVAVLAVAAIVLAAVAVNADFGAEHARDQALSRQVALESQQLQSTDPALAAQLALAAYRISPTVQASSTLLDATSGELPARLLGPIGPQSVSVSADGHLLAVAQAATDTVALYRLSSGAPEKLATLDAGPGSQKNYAVAVSPNGRLVATGGTEGTITLWGVSNPDHPTRLGTITGIPNTVYSLDFAPNDLSLAAADGNGTILRWNIADSAHPQSQMALSMPGTNPVRAVTYSPNSTTLAGAGDSGALAVWQNGDQTPIVASGTNDSDFQTVSFNPDGSELAVGSGNDDTISAWTLVGNQLHLAAGPIVAATSEIDSVAYSPDGSILAESSADGSIRLYDTKTWQPITTFGDPDPVTSLAFTDGGNALVSADSGGVTRIWPLPSPSTYTQPGNVYSLTYNSAGTYLVSSSAGATGGVTIWRDTNPLRPTRLVNVTLPTDFGAAAGDAAISPNGHVLAVANANAQIQLFNLTDMTHPAPIEPLLEGNKPYVEQLSFSQSGNLLLASDDTGQVRIWNVTNPTQPRALPTIQSGTGQVLGFGITSNGTLLATASSDTKVRLYNISNPEHATLLATLGGFASYAYDATVTPNGHTLIAGSADGTIRIWNITNPAHPQLLGPPLTGPTGYVFQVAVSPDGNTLAAASTAHAVWLWNIRDPSDPKLLDTLAAAQDEVFIVRFNPDNRVLAASGSDNTLHLWNYQPDQAAHRVCSLTGDQITRSEWSQYIQGASYKPPC